MTGSLIVDFWRRLFHLLRYISVFQYVRLIPGLKGSFICGSLLQMIQMPFCKSRFPLHPLRLARTQILLNFQQQLALLFLEFDFD